MPHYEVDYSKLSDDEAHNKAIQDIKKWLGSTRKFNQTALQFQAAVGTREIKNWAMWEFYCGMSGFQGFTVIKAFAVYCKVWRYIRPKAQDS